MKKTNEDKILEELRKDIDKGLAEFSGPAEIDETDETENPFQEFLPLPPLSLVMPPELLAQLLEDIEEAIRKNPDWPNGE